MAGQMQQEAAALGRASRDIQDAEQQLSTMLSRLEGEIVARSSDWQGAGATAFFRLFENWRGETRKVISALVTFHDHIDATHTITADVDAQQDANVQAIATRLGAH